LIGIRGAPNEYKLMHNTTEEREGIAYIHCTKLLAYTNYEKHQAKETSSTRERGKM